MDLEMLKAIASQGVVGILAFGMFKVYEKTTKDHADKLAVHIANWKGQSELLVGMVERNTEAMTALRVVLDRDTTSER